MPLSTALPPKPVSEAAGVVRWLMPPPRRPIRPRIADVLPRGLNENSERKPLPLPVLVRRLAQRRRPRAGWGRRAPVGARRGRGGGASRAEEPRGASQASISCPGGSCPPSGRKSGRQGMETGRYPAGGGGVGEAERARRRRLAGGAGGWSRPCAPCALGCRRH
ncbi:translation initiation factor IF-2-like [Choloepus didactylus]|uniref:translation initiation factor IF-2-like n=1 Tax=Choloepus didactylus TaxID=27675 RepID=UPI00189FCED0|nr:translation initiation factor IF-2-like [Choloepus didactylus]